MHGSAVLVIAGEAVKPSSIRVSPFRRRVRIRDSCPSGLREWCRTTPGVLGRSLSGVTLKVSHDNASRVEGAITWQYLGACSAPKVPNIRGLGGKDVPLHRVWEYRDIGRLFITVGGGESDNRGAEVGLSGGDSPGQSGGHSPASPATAG